MINALVGEKKQMTQMFVGTTRVPVTCVKVGPCVVTQIKTEDKDGYASVQIGFGEKNLKNITKPMKGHLKGALKDKKKAPRFLCEVRVDKDPGLKVGDEVSLTDVFSKGDIVAVTGRSKGKGFQGVIKRWNFAGSSRTHGGHGQWRSPGSIGQGTTPGRVRKGKKMGGRMGGDMTFVPNLQIVSIDKEAGEICIAGSVPGGRGTLLVIEKTAAGNVADLEEEVKEVVAQVEEEPKEEAENKEE